LPAPACLHSLDVAVLYILPVPVISGRYEARYFRYYGQIYAARPLGALVTGGASVRGTLVDYQHLTYEGHPFMPTNHFFIEPTLFARVGHGVVQAEGTLGLSLPTGGSKDNPFNLRTAPVSTLVSVGIIFRPDLLKRSGK
jgi:hypothetical protein